MALGLPVPPSSGPWVYGSQSVSPLPSQGTLVLPETTTLLGTQPLTSQRPPCTPRNTLVLPGNLLPSQGTPSAQIHPPPLRDSTILPGTLSAGEEKQAPRSCALVTGPRALDGGRPDTPQPSPRWRPRLGPQTCLGHVTVLLHNGSGVELLGRDQAQPQGLRSRAKASGVASPSAHCLYTPLCPMVSAPLPPVPPVLLTFPVSIGTHPEATTAATTPSPLSNVLEPSMGASWSPLGWTVQPGQQRQREVRLDRAGGVIGTPVIGRHPGPETPPAAEAPGDAGASWPLRAPGAGPKTASSSIPTWPTCLDSRASRCPCSQVCRTLCGPSWP